MSGYVSVDELLLHERVNIDKPITDIHITNDEKIIKRQFRRDAA